MASPTSNSNATLSAHYASPASAKDFSHPLNASSRCNSADDKTAYLSELRRSVAKLQDEVNVFLTQKMEDDKLLAGRDGSKVDDKREEENYGEEILDDNDP